jgi:outer membrane lipoprotein-sorting protein
MEKDPEGIFMRKISNRHLTIYLFLFLSLFLRSLAVSSSETDMDEEPELNWVLKNIKQAQVKLKTFSAKMVQIRKTQLLKSPLQSEGLIYFESNGKMLFKVTSPEPLLVLFKDGMVLINYPDISKVEQRYIGRNTLKEFFGIGQSIEELGKYYSIELGSKTPSDSYHLKLVPKRESMGKYFDSIEVKVNSNLWLPERIYYREKNGDWTSIQLEFTSINEPLPPNIFNMRFLENYEDEQ